MGETQQQDRHRAQTGELRKQLKSATQRLEAVKSKNRAFKTRLKESEGTLAQRDAVIAEFQSVEQLRNNYIINHYHICCATTWVYKAITNFGMLFCNDCYDRWIPKSQQESTEMFLFFEVDAQKRPCSSHCRDICYSFQRLPYEVRLF